MGTLVAAGGGGDHRGAIGVGRPAERSPPAATAGGARGRPGPSIVCAALAQRGVDRHRRRQDGVHAEAAQKVAAGRAQTISAGPTVTIAHAVRAWAVRRDRRRQWQRDPGIGRADSQGEARAPSSAPPETCTTLETPLMTTGALTFFRGSPFPIWALCRPRPNRATCSRPGSRTRHRIHDPLNPSGIPDARHLHRNLQTGERERRHTASEAGDSHPRSGQDHRCQTPTPSPPS